MNIAIVTSASNGYGQYLDDWADSILALTTLPAMAAVAHTASERDAAQRACRRLADAGLRVAACELDGAPNVGVLRNAAVALSDTEWVMHFDADDQLLPHALCDVAALAPHADVVALGYERSGDLRAGPSNPRRLYSDTVGKQALQSTAPASGVSPFRRSFWERSPYRTDMAGGWDTALWLGFAHLGARFRATRRSAFQYRQHADSVFNTRRKSERGEAFVGAKLQALRAGRAGVAVVVPWRDDDGPRAAAWAWVQRWYAEHFPDWQVVVGECEPGAWNKGAAVAAGLSRTNALTVVVADADCVVDPAALREAVRLVQAGEAPWVVPHTLVHRLDEPSTAAVLAQAPGAAQLGGRVIRTPYTGFAGGGLVVVDRSAYETAGGIPREFTGWGCEDEALALVLDALLGPHVRLPGDLWHLWHEPGPRMKEAHYAQNRHALRRYQRAAGNADAMWAVVRRASRSTARRLHERACLAEARQQRVEEIRAARERRIRGTTYLQARRAG